MATARRHHRAPPGLRRSSLGRRLDEADSKPPQSVYGLQRHAPAFARKAHGICQRSVNALRFDQEGRWGIGVDAKTGRQMLQRQDPTPWGQAGQPETREHESSRPGVRALRASFLVPTGPGLWKLGVTRTSEEVAAHVAHVVRQLPDRARSDWVRDKLHTPGSLEVCRLVAAWCQRPGEPTRWQRGVQRRAVLSDPDHPPGLPCTPIHGAWLPQVARWVAVLARRFLKRGDLGSVEACAGRWGESLEV